MHRILVIANRTCPCPALLEEVARRARVHEPCDVLIVAPALNSRVRHYVSDVDGALAQARERLDLALSGLSELGIEAAGDLGDSDPYVAIGDALARFAATEMIVSTLPPGHSNWLERGLIERADRDFEIPLTHLVSRYGLPAPAAA
jgi:GABA permease